jgi:hypothetical protein
MAEECKDNDTEWQQMKDSVLNSVIEMIQNETMEPWNRWWDEDIQKHGKKKSSQNEMYI